MSEHIVPRGTYIKVFIALMVLMFFQALLSKVPMHGWNTEVLLTVATCKALLVLLFFMHIKYENYKITLVAIVGGVFWLFIMLGLTMTDYLSRGLTGFAPH